MSVLKGDYIGFTYNGVHSSSLGIIRVSDGSRFNENLLPAFQEKTTQVPGGDGTYYFGSHYTQNKFSIQIAFDEITEQQLRQLKDLFGDRKPHPLIFDEAPYKAYQAKVTGSNILKYVPFNDPFHGRIFKGEGEIQFVCYQPYAICSGEMRDYDYYFGNCENLKEWEEAADLVSLRGYDEINNGIIQVRNPGVKDSECILKFQSDSGKFYGAVFTLEENYLEFAGCKSKTHPRNTAITDSYITFNSKNHLIEGWYDNNGILEKSGNIYNEYIIAGDFFNIPTMEGREMGPKIFINPRRDQEQSLADQFISIDYDYYYY